MSIFSKLLGKKTAEGADETVRVGGMEDFMTLIRVYYQAVMAAQLGISNINFLPDLAVFKRTLKVPTQNNKLADTNPLDKEFFSLSLSSLFFFVNFSSIYSPSLFNNLSKSILSIPLSLKSLIRVFKSESKYFDFDLKALKKAFIVFSCAKTSGSE